MCICSNFNVKHTLLYVQASYLVRTHVTFDRRDVVAHGKNSDPLPGKRSKWQKIFSSMQNRHFTRTHTRAALFTLVSAPAPSADSALTRADNLLKG